MKKRDFLSLSTASLTGLAGVFALNRASHAQQQCDSPSEPATFVLVHGAWGGSFVYDDIAERLRRIGHQVFTPSLTGLGERTHLVHPEVNLTTHIDDVVGVIRFHELSDIVLVGHSYGGFVISGVADSVEDDIRSIIFLDAFIPGHYDSFAEGLSPDMPNNTLPLPRSVFQEFGIADRDSWKYSDHPIGSFLEVRRFQFNGAHERISKKSYVWANRWPEHEATFNRLSADAAWNTHSVDSGHMVMFDAPDRLTEILAGAI